MATNTTLCEPCSGRKITKPSTYWCSECEEAICDDCQQHHKVFKATRSHELIPIAKYKSIPSFITDIQHLCTYHNEKYQQYCVSHALPICFKCIKEHQKCNVIPLDEVTNNAKTSGHFQDLETRLMDLLQNIDIIRKDRKAYLESIEERKEIHLAEIQQIRNQINKHLDKLEKEIIQDLQKKECQCKKSNKMILSAVQAKENLITEYQKNLQSIKEHASDLQTFLVMRDIEMAVFENEQYLQSLGETNKFEPVDLIFKVDPGLINILDILRNFGSFEIKTQFQVTPTKTINDLKLRLQQEITTCGETVRGCCMSFNDEYLFTDYCWKKKLNVIASDGTFKYNMLLRPSDGFDMIFIDEKTIAITSGDSYKHIGIDIIYTESRKKINFINLPDRPWGITRDHNSLFVCVEGCGIYKINTADYTTSHVISCKLPPFSYVSVFDTTIYYTDWYDHSVVCCDRNGSRVWAFKDFSVLNFPRGIAVDNDGNVFVVGETSSNVVMISNDGKHYKQILTIDDGLREPSAIFFDKQTRKLLVANNKETAFLYSVT
ncbi:uncharacterized protein [Mytilus edulis]|uniref:uncharacterized protein n=1 Tax=Mytilus edulis TaxID=6550 RepID=UPI0039EEAA2F